MCCIYATYGRKKNAYYKWDKETGKGIRGGKRKERVRVIEREKKHLSIFVPNELPLLPSLPSEMPQDRNSTETTFIVFVAI